MELWSLGFSLLRVRPRSSLIFLTSSSATSRFLAAAGNPSDSVLFKLINSQRSALSTNASLLQEPVASTASSSETDAAELPPPEPPTPPSHEPLGATSAGDFVRHMNVHEQAGESGRSTYNVFNIKDRKSAFWKHSAPSSAEETAHASSESRSSTPSRPAYSPGGIIDNMMIPGQLGATRTRDPVIKAATNKSFRPRAVRTIESSPRVGRTVEVNPRKRVDLSRALRNLNYQCAVNNVRRDQRQQRFHERPGLKRKRLRRENYRARFKQGFRLLVAKVKHMKKQGW